MLLFPRRSVLLCALTLTLGASGCISPDTEGSLDDFRDRAFGVEDAGADVTDVTADVSTDVATDANPDATPCDVTPDPVGTWFFALSATLDRTLPLYLQFDVTATDDGTLTFTGTPLVRDLNEDGGAEDGARTQTELGEPIAGYEEPFTATTTMDAEGNFRVEFPNISVPALANPLTFRTIAGTLVLNGRFYNNDVAFGALEGSVDQPTALPLTGSTFAGVRAEPADFPSIDPVYFCGGEENCSARDFAAIPYDPITCEGEGSGGGVDSCDLTPIPDGTWFFALSATLDRTLPLYMQFDVSTDAAGALSFDGVALVRDLAEDGGAQPNARTPAPASDPIEGYGMPIEGTGTLGDDGSFRIELALITVPDVSNPLTFRAIAGTLILDGKFYNDDVAYGIMEGSVDQPTALPLAGSTFAGVRAEPEAFGAIDPVFYCGDPCPAGDHAPVPWEPLTCADRP